MALPYSTTGPLIRTKYQNRHTGERTAELRANLYVEGDLDVTGDITKSGAPLETGGDGLQGSGTANTIGKFTEDGSVGDSLITDDGTSIITSAVIFAPIANAGTGLGTNTRRFGNNFFENLDVGLFFTWGFALNNAIPKFSAGVMENSSITDDGTTVMITGEGLQVGGAVTFTSLPTSDPGVAGRLWNDAGIVKVSAG